MAIGTKAISNNQDSYAFGINIKSSADNAFTLGIGPGGNQFLENSIENSMMFGIGSLYPTLLISKAYDENKTGKIGIGNVTNPDAKLHIRADDDEDASILLEPTGSGYMGKLMIGDDNHTIQARQGNNMEFKTEANKNFVFQNGSIYIQDAFEGLILKSPDGQCWKGTADNDGNFVLENIDCSLVTGKDEQSAISQNVARIFPNPAGSKLYIEVPEEVQQSYVSIYNEQGVLLQSRDLQSGKNTIPLKKIPAGILIVKVYTGSGKLLSTEKIMHR